MIKIKYLDQDRLLLLLFPTTILVLHANHTLFTTGNQSSVIYTYAQNFLKGEIGPGYGYASSEPFDKTNLEPGDILLGGWSNCAYGEYSHAGLYLGNDEVLEAYIDYGITTQPLQHYLNYSNLCILRIKAPSETKAQAIAYASQQKKKIFYPLAFKKGERFWNCTKLIWKAYAINQIDLDEINDIWIAPDSFRNSMHVITLSERQDN